MIARLEGACKYLIHGLGTLRPQVQRDRTEACLSHLGSHDHGFTTNRPQGPLTRRAPVRKRSGRPSRQAAAPFVEGCLSGPVSAGSGNIVSPSPTGNAKAVPVACTLLVYALVPGVRLRPAVPRFSVPDRQRGDPGLPELQEMLEGRWHALRTGGSGSASEPLMGSPSVPGVHERTDVGHGPDHSRDRRDHLPLILGRLFAPRAQAEDRVQEEPRF